MSEKHSDQYLNAAESLASFKGLDGEFISFGDQFPSIWVGTPEDIVVSAIALLGHESAKELENSLSQS